MDHSYTSAWIVLIHQIPPEPNALRVKIWRRLQQVGALAIKQAVYVLPSSEQAREDMNWILNEIIEGGGNGWILEARFVAGITDDQLIEQFQEARKGDYEKLIREANSLLSDLPSAAESNDHTFLKFSSRVSRLQRRFNQVVAIDFFQAPQRWEARAAIKNLTEKLRHESAGGPSFKVDLDTLRGKVWVTRKNVFVDRIACGWLIRRFIDSEATFRFVDSEAYHPDSGEIRFDMFEGEFTHQGNRCTFEVMIRYLRLENPELIPIAEIVHDLDLKDGKYGRPETEGLGALITGLQRSLPADEDRMEKGARFFEVLHRYFSEHG